MSQKQSKKSNKDLVLQFTNFLKFKKGLSANTISAYESDITQFLEFTGENIINNDLIELFITSELNNKSDNSKIRKITKVDLFKVGKSLKSKLKKFSFFNGFHCSNFLKVGQS